MKAYDTMQEKTPAEYDVSVKFGEYASPGFDSTVEVVGKAKSYGIMSTERCVSELYGDTMTEEEQTEEVARIKAENSTAIDEPLVKQDGTDNEEEGADNGDNETTS